MEQILIIFVTLFFIFLPTNVLARKQLPAAYFEHVHKQTHAMSSFLELSKQDTNTILNAKIEFARLNEMLNEQHQQGTSEFKMARASYLRDYQTTLYSIVSKEDLKRYNQLG